MTARLSSLLCLALLAVSCFGPRSVAVSHETWETEDGVIVRDLFSGVGEGARFGDAIALEYVSWLDDGTEIDSTRHWGRPVEFTLGEAPISGWNHALLGIAVGGKRRLVLPPETAYGDVGVPGVVPPAATLIFEVERVVPPVAEADEASEAPVESPDESADEAPAGAISEPSAPEANSESPEPERG